jgi:hypothetical protein
VEEAIVKLWLLTRPRNVVEDYFEEVHNKHHHHHQQQQQQQQQQASPEVAITNTGQRT